MISVVGSAEEEGRRKKEEGRSVVFWSGAERGCACLPIDCPQTKRRSSTARLRSPLLESGGDLRDRFNYGRNASLIEEDSTARNQEREVRESIGSAEADINEVYVWERRFED